jgi:hypothetical protein
MMIVNVIFFQENAERFLDRHLNGSLKMGLNRSMRLPTQSAHSENINMVRDFKMKLEQVM